VDVGSYRMKIKIPKQEIKRFLIKGRLMLENYEELINSGKDSDDAFQDIEINAEVRK
jgi:hypothetical protein